MTLRRRTEVHPGAATPAGPAQTPAPAPSFGLPGRVSCHGRLAVDRSDFKDILYIHWSILGWAMRVDKAERVKLSDLAHEEIRRRIVSGAFAMGRKLPEGELSELLGMSRSPIREALVQLEREGLVEMPPDRTAHVFAMDRAQIIDLGELREILEREALDLAMARSQPALAEALAAVVRDMGAAIEAGDAQRYRALDQDFHSAIFASCGNGYLRSNYLMLSFRIEALRTWLSLDSELNRISFADHQALASLVRGGDVTGAQALLHKHIGETTANYLARFATSSPAGARAPLRVPLAEMEGFAARVLESTGADSVTVAAVIRALSHASGLGVDSHGYRLLPHYLAGLCRGRLNPRPALRLVAGKGGAGVLDADNAHGAVAAFAAADHAVAFARAHGLGAVAIRNSSHFGAAGAYAMAMADQGMMGLAVCNSDSFVRLHSGAARFHGTNPIAAAAPNEGTRPWLLDMATSAIPFNRVILARALGQHLPRDVAADAEGRFVIDPVAAEMLAPLGGALFGYKGAGLAGLAEILSAALSDAPLSVELPAMISDDMETPRRLGGFVLALDPEAFGGAAVFRAVVTRYIDLVRGSRRAGAEPVMAAGDREWEEEARRRSLGIVLDPDTVANLNAYAAERSLPPLVPTGAEQS